MPAFWTVPYVAIQDKALGTAYYAGLLVVVLHLGQSLIQNHKYLEYDSLQGVTRPKVKASKNFVFPDASERAYCANPDIIKCSVLDAEEVSESTLDMLFVTTSIKELKQKAECGADDSCDQTRFTKVSSQNIYPIAVEDFNMTLLGNVQAFNFYQDSCLDLPPPVHDQDGRIDVSQLHCPFAGSHKQMEGRVLSSDGKVLARIPTGQDDKFPLSLWLKAAGFSLDDTTDSLSKIRHGKDSFRFKGSVLLVTISYSNKQDMSFFASMMGEVAPLSYDLTVQRMAYTEYKTKHITGYQSLGNGTHYRTQQNRRGLVFRVVQTGKIGRFSWGAVLNTVVLKLGLLALVQTVLDMLWCYILPLFGYTDWSEHVFQVVGDPASRADAAIADDSDEAPSEAANDEQASVATTDKSEGEKKDD